MQLFGRDTESNAKAAEVLKIGPNFSSERFIKAASIKIERSLIKH